MRLENEVAALRKTLAAVTDGVQRLGGDVLALEFALMAVIGAHPDRKTLRDVLSATLEAADALMTGEATSDLVLHSFQAKAEQIKRAIEKS
jgi:hypothetical protein